MWARDTHPHSPKMQSSENHNFHYRFSPRGQMNWNSFLFGGYPFRALSLKCIKISMTFAFSFCIIIFWWFDKIFGWMCAMRVQKPFSREKCYSHCLTHISTHWSMCARGKNFQNNGSILRVISINFSFVLSLSPSRLLAHFWLIEKSKIDMLFACNKEIISGLLAWSSSSSSLTHEQKKNETKPIYYQTAFCVCVRAHVVVWVWVCVHLTGNFSSSSGFLLPFRFDWTE